ncbi:MAG: oxygen-independent coproporphyrinogen III oxidase [Rhodospirillaceae bacterium]|nr:oxygen-independent coproporphyrinogen III oxidase [Rhodospirillaceae bacterium]
MSSDAVVKRDNMSWLELEAPRYTSYPSAHHFVPQTNESPYRQWLENIGYHKAVSVYIHIPFCRELCWFCGCHTKITRRHKPIYDYIQVMLQEIKMLQHFIKGKGTLVNIYFGGGSPNLLEDSDLRSILTNVSSIFKIVTLRESSIELDPRTTSPEKVALYSSLGFNRVSIGVQDFDPKVQLSINRFQPYSLVEKVVKNLRAAGIDQINCDLIYGLPHQTLGNFRNTLEKTISLNPSRIAIFSYAHIPHIKKHQRMIDATWLPSPKEKLSLYLLAHEFLQENGYTAIGIDHFAKPADPLTIAFKNHTLKRNFQGYVSDDTEVLIGIGSSAISHFPQGYVQNSPNMPEYQDLVGNNTLPTIRGWQMSKDDQLQKTVIDELLCFMRVDLEEISKRFAVDPSYFKKELDTLQSLESLGIVKTSGYVVEIVSQYRMTARVVASVFDKYHSTMAGRYSKVV